MGSGNFPQGFPSFDCVRHNVGLLSGDTNFRACGIKIAMCAKKISNTFREREGVDSSLRIVDFPVEPVVFEYGNFFSCRPASVPPRVRAKEDAALFYRSTIHPSSFRSERGVNDLVKF